MIYKAYKYRIYPNAEQRMLIEKHIGCARWVYNYGLNKKVESYQQTGKGVSRFDIQKELPILKKNNETEWLKEVNSLSLQASLEHLDKAFTKFFRDKKGFPKFKSKKLGRQSFSIPQNTNVYFEKQAVSIPKIKTLIKCKLHRIFYGAIKTSTISRTPTGKYFISILVETLQEIPKKKPIDEKQAIGVDLGIKTFAVLSNGIEIQNPKYLSKSMNSLKRMQKSVSRKKKGSNNRKKAVKRLAILHEKVSNQRADFLHKQTSYLVNTYDTICLETLKSSNMIKNHKLAQSLSDISIGRFNEMLDYKANWNGVNILRIGQFEPSSKMCSCGAINRELKLSDRVWTCNSCGLTHDRDKLAADNIKRFAFLKNNTAGTVEIQSCGDMEGISLLAQEASTL